MLNNSMKKSVETRFLILWALKHKTEDYMLKVLFVGDIVGNPGRKAARAVIPGIRKEMGIDLCIATRNAALV